jgi:hypothetical protein
MESQEVSAYPCRSRKNIVRADLYQRYEIGDHEDAIRGELYIQKDLTPPECDNLTVTIEVAE